MHIDYMQNKLLLFTTFLLAVISACNFDAGSLDTVMLELDMPHFPAVWAGADSWEVYICASAPPGKAGNLKGTYVYLQPGDIFTARLDRKKEALIFARACFGSFRSLPLAFVWPQSLPEGKTPGIEAGYAAAVTEALYNAGCKESPIDLLRLGREASARMEDPWDLNPINLAYVIMTRRFRADHLKSAEKEAIKLPETGLEDGIELAPDSPWAKAAFVQNGIAELEIVPNQARRWFNKQIELSVLLDRKSVV